MIEILALRARTPRTRALETMTLITNQKTLRERFHQRCDLHKHFVAHNQSRFHLSVTSNEIFDLCLDKSFFVRRQHDFRTQTMRSEPLLNLTFPVMNKTCRRHNHNLLHIRILSQHDERCRNCCECFACVCLSIL